ncbi:hypothetical protein C3L33_20435, partial [Rhododendron williamsianum]
MSQKENDDDKQHPDETIDQKIDKAIEEANRLFCARIYRVPEDLRTLNKSAYTPRVIAIGPLHRKKKHLRTPIVPFKMYYTNSLLDRVAKVMDIENNLTDQKFKVLQQCEEKMAKCVEGAKKYYADDVTLDKEMMLVDGCFILELLYCHRDKMSKQAGKKTTNGGDNGKSQALSSIPQPNGGEGSSKSGGGSVKQERFDPIFDNIWTADLVKQDLLLLENQIPFFVLEELFKLTVAKIPDENKLSLEEYVLSYFGNVMRPENENCGSKKTSCCCCCLPTCLPGYCVLSVGDCVLSVGRSTQESEHHKLPGHKYYHILHLVHDYELPGGQGENKQKKYTGLEVSASELDYAGVNFAPAEENKLFNVKFKEPPGICWWFHRAEFKIPTLNIDDSTESILRNLIALEQCCPGVQRHFTSYAKFIDMLINSKKDVEVLKKAKVIRNHLGTDADVSRLFNKLCKEVVTGEFYFSEQYQDAYKYSKYSWPKWMAYWKRKYFDSPWAFRGVIIVYPKGVT